MPPRATTSQQTPLEEVEQVTLDTTNQVTFDKATVSAGTAHGLYQTCMKSIRSAHGQANKLRAALTVAGLLTDAKIYREVLAIFYAVTKEMEWRLRQTCRTDDVICQKLLATNYAFTAGYEKDLAFLYRDEKDWKEQVEQILKAHPVALEYRQLVQSMTTGAQLAGAAFVLWGALIIGGGAAAMPRVKAMAGEEATHVFQQVVAGGIGGRLARKEHWAGVWDDLAEPGSPTFDVIVEHAQLCMQYNNRVFSSLQRKPWWWSMITTSVGVAVFAIVAFWFRKQMSVSQ